MCFSLEWLKELLIWIVLACVLVGIVKVLVPMVLSWFGAPPGGNAVITSLGYIVWAVIAILVIIFVFDLISCVIGSGALHGPGLRLG